MKKNKKSIKKKKKIVKKVLKKKKAIKKVLKKKKVVKKTIKKKKVASKKKVEAKKTVKKFVAPKMPQQSNKKVNNRIINPSHYQAKKVKKFLEIKTIKEKNECPICHTVIGDIEENLEVEVEELRNVENVEDSEITCFCRCYSFTCYHINSQNTKEAFELILYGLKITLVFLIVGFISYNIIALLSFHSIPNVINETKDNYLTTSFYLLLISLGIVTISTFLLIIGICLRCFCSE